MHIQLSINHINNMISSTMMPIAPGSMYNQQALIKNVSSSSSSTTMGKQLQQQPMAITSLASMNALNIPKKPMRPLTAYHIFFQIEREYVIQTSAGEVADKSTMDNKILLDDVPQRYKNIRLLPDWYAGPGKRGKRKHRKQHGKIGFLELSKVISTRWAKLDEVDPETKVFVQKIAKSEVEEYYREMADYKEKIKHLPPSMIPTKKTQQSKKRNSIVLPIQHQHYQQQQQQVAAAHPDMVSSFHHQQQQQQDVCNSSYMPPISAQMSQDIDFFLSSCVNNHGGNNIGQQQQHQSQFTMPPSFTFEEQQVPKKMKMSHRHSSPYIGGTSQMTSPFPTQDMFKADIDTDINLRDMFQRSVSELSVSDDPVSHQVSELSVTESNLLMNDPNLWCQPIAAETDTVQFQRRVSNGSSGSSNQGSGSFDLSLMKSPSSVEVDLCDDEIMKLWKETSDFLTDEPIQVTNRARAA